MVFNIGNLENMRNFGIPVNYKSNPFIESVGTKDAVFF